MDLRDIPSIYQTVSAIASLYSAHIAPYCRTLHLPVPTIPNRKYTLLLMGNYNAGKSSFVNHCIGRQLLRTGHGRTTERLTFILPGAMRQTLTLSYAREYFSEIADLLLYESADAVVEVYPGMRQFERSESAYLSYISSVFEPQKTVPASPFFFIDTPGITDASEFGLMKKLAPKVDQILFFVDSGGFYLSKQTCEYLQFLAAEKLFGKLSIVLSKVDQLDSKFQAVQAIANCVQLVHRVVPFTDFRIFPISLPKFLQVKTKVYHYLNSATQAFEKSKLYYSISLCESDVADAIIPAECNHEPFLAAQFDLLAELENLLVDYLIAQFNQLLDRYAEDVRKLDKHLAKHENEALARRRYNTSLLWAKITIGGFLATIIVNFFVQYVQVRFDRYIAAALACLLLVFMLLSKRIEVPLQRLTEMQSVVENQLMKTVNEIEKAK